jgi:8-oxo-dGTP diphosphatase
MNLIHNHNEIRATATVVVFSVINNRLCVLVALPHSQTTTTTWALPEEDLNNTESAEQTVRRTLSEHFDLKDIYLEQVITLDSINSHSPRTHKIDIVYLALIKDIGKTLLSSTKYKLVQWRMPGSLPKLTESHGLFIKALWKKFNDKLSRTNIAKNLLPSHFTLGELQGTYESILGRDLDTRNFRNKIIKSNLIIKTEKMRGGANRPAALYSFVSHTKSFLDLP